GPFRSQIARFSVVYLPSEENFGTLHNWRESQNWHTKFLASTVMMWYTAFGVCVMPTETTICEIQTTSGAPNREASIRIDPKSHTINTNSISNREKRGIFSADRSNGLVLKIQAIDVALIDDQWRSQNDLVALDLQSPETARLNGLRPSRNPFVCKQISRIHRRVSQIMCVPKHHSLYTPIMDVRLADAGQ